VKPSVRATRLSENTYLLRYPHPESLRRTFLYASFLGISNGLHLIIFTNLEIACYCDRQVAVIRKSASVKGRDIAWVTGTGNHSMLPNAGFRVKS
jgi:hypothetical protein